MVVTPSEIYKQISPAVVEILEYKGDDLYAKGSGWVYKFQGSCYVVTAGHCIEDTGKDITYAVLDSAHNEYKIVGSFSSRYNDVAYIRISGWNEATLKFAASSPSVGTTIYNVGYPSVYNHEFLGVGYIASCKRGAYLAVYIDACAGSSGSPVVNSHGYVIGIINSANTDFARMMFALPAGTIRKDLGF